jgi:hypothetical protein
VKRRPEKKLRQWVWLLGLDAAMGRVADLQERADDRRAAWRKRLPHLLRTY